MGTDTAIWRNPNYHDETDTLATLDFPRVTRVVLGLVAAVGELVI
jgi:hypothetical protein